MRHIFLYILFFVCLFSKTYAQEKSNETLDQLVRASIAYAPKIKEQQQMVLMGDFRTKIQESALKPQISTEIGVIRFDPVAKAQFGASSIQFQPNMNYNANIGGNYVIYDWGKQLVNIEK